MSNRDPKTMDASDSLLLSQYLSLLRENWDRFGRSDPFYWVLTSPEKEGNRWQVEEFFETGKGEIEGIMRQIADLGIDLRLGRALDFGCGVGRLTQALSAHFEESYGVDIAPSMIVLANLYNRYGNKCRYAVNSAADLSLFSDDFFDLVYSNIALQHVHPICSKRYIREFVRVLQPRGVAVFQLPSEPVNASQRFDPGLPAVSADPRRPPTIEMYGVPLTEIVQWVKQSGAEVRHIEDDHLAGPEWISVRYFVSKASK